MPPISTDDVVDVDRGPIVAVRDQRHPAGNRVRYRLGVEATGNRLERSVNRVVLHEESRGLLDGGRSAQAHAFLERCHVR